MLGRMLRGEDSDPLDWIWRGDASPDAAPATSASPLRRMTKLAAYQLGLYVSGVFVYFDGSDTMGSSTTIPVRRPTTRP